MPRMATLTYSHFGNPEISNHCAHYIVNQINKVALPSLLIVVGIYSAHTTVDLCGLGARRLVTAH